MSFFYKVLLLQLICINLCTAQTDVVTATEPVVNQPKQNQPQSTELVRPFKRIFAYSLAYTRSSLVMTDGYGITDERYILTNDELSSLSDIKIMRNAIKREQRRLAKILIASHPYFINYKPFALAALSKNISDKIDADLDKMQTIDILVRFHFDYFRAHVLKLCARYAITKNIKLYNTTGVNESLTTKLMPKEPFEYVAMAALVLNLLLAFIYILKIKNF